MQNELTRLAFQMGRSDVDPGLLLTGDTLVTPEPSIDLGDALKLLADRRQKMEDTQKLIAEAQLKQAEATLKDDLRIQGEKSRWVYLSCTG